MKSALRGRSISEVEITNVSKHGLWLWLRDREVFLSYKQFPWFEHAPIGQVLNVKLLNADHLYWSDLDVDLHVESIEAPERYPLISRARPNKPAPPGRVKGRARSSRRGRTGNAEG